jgi:hypothetical protein
MNYHSTEVRNTEALILHFQVLQSIYYWLTSNGPKTTNAPGHNWHIKEHLLARASLRWSSDLSRNCHEISIL